MQFSERISQVKPSMTLVVNNRAQELRAQGVDVLSLAVGEPDFSTPDFIKDAAKRAIDENFSRYTPAAGIPELRKAAGDYFQRNYAASVPPESIIIGVGGKQCLYTMLQCTLNPGDEVLIPAPYWVSYPAMVELAGGVPVTVSATSAENFKVNPALLDSKATKRTRMLILNSPNNPTGAVYSAEELSLIMDWAMTRKVFVLADEIYDQLVFAPAKMSSAISWFERYPELIAVVNGLSKSYAMTGWRVGYLAGHPDLIKKMAVLQGQSVTNVCSIAQKAALAALTGPQNCVAEMREAFERRRNLAFDLISSWPFALCPKPEGAFYLFIDLSRCYGGKVKNSLELCAWLLDKTHVALVPGVAFGDDACVRISYAVSDAMLLDALGRVGTALSELAS